MAVGYRSDEGSADETVAKVRAEGAQALSVHVDITDEGSVDGAFRSVEAELGPVRVLVNNAGFIKDGLAVRYSTQNWDATVDTNLRGAFFVGLRCVTGLASVMP